MKPTLLLLGAATTAAGVLAFLAPLTFHALFAEYTGAANAHLLRDVGAAYISAGLALAWAAFIPRWRGPLVSVAAFFLVLHAVGHVMDLAFGDVPLSHIAADAVEVFIPAIVISALAVFFLRTDKS